MGCGSSNVVATVEPGNGRPTERNSKQGKDVVPNKNPNDDTSLDRNDNVTNMKQSNSFTNVNNSSVKEREISASSARTEDSGISELKDGEIVAEKSNPDKIINATDRPNTPELFLEGRACQRLQSGKEKRRLELENKNQAESSIATLPPLSCDVNLLQRPKTRGGGIAFDVRLFPETGNIKRAPANLPKLERKRGKKLTKEELNEKMSRATERRKDHERKIVEKSQVFITAYGNNHTKTQAEKNDEEYSENSERQNETSWKEIGNDTVCL